MADEWVDSRKDGLVVWFSDAQGYGFIGIPGERDVFCHFTAIRQEGKSRRTLAPGQRVKVEVREGAKGRFAAQVEVVGREE